MAVEDFQATWRGARRYQFDEEVRRKRAAQSKVAAFRQTKQGEPEKLKVLVEDLAPEPPDIKISTGYPLFPIAVAVCVVVFFITLNI